MRDSILFWRYREHARKRHSTQWTVVVRSRRQKNTWEIISRRNSRNFSHRIPLKLLNSFCFPLRIYITSWVYQSRLLTSVWWGTGAHMYSHAHNILLGAFMRFLYDLWYMSSLLQLCVFSMSCLLYEATKNPQWKVLTVDTQHTEHEGWWLLKFPPPVPVQHELEYEMCLPPVWSSKIHHNALLILNI